MEGEDGEKGGEDEREGSCAEADSGKVRKCVEMLRGRNSDDDAKYIPYDDIN